MSARRKGRELALQVLYQLDMSGEGAERVLESFAESFEHTPKARAFGEALARGVLAQREQIDARDHRSLRHLAVELTVAASTPTSSALPSTRWTTPPLPAIQIAINEAVEVATQVWPTESAAVRQRSPGR